METREIVQAILAICLILLIGTFYLGLELGRAGSRAPAPPAQSASRRSSTLRELARTKSASIATSL